MTRGLGSRQVQVLALAGLSSFFVSFDGAVLILALPAIAADFRTTVGELTDLGSALALGTLAGLPLGVMADRMGRRRLVALAVAGFSLANLASAAAPGLGWLAGARLVAVCFETAAASAATALVVEEVDAERRGLAVAALAVAAGAGIGLTTVLYPPLAPNWRLLYLLGAAGLAAALLLARLLPESRAWTASAAAAGLQAPPRLLPVRLLARPPWRARLAVAAAAAALSAMLYRPAGLLYALFGSQQLGLDATAISAVVVVSGLAGVPAFLVGGGLSDRFGRRAPAVGLAVLTAAFAAVSFSGQVILYWLGNVLWSVLASTSVPVLGAWYGELFPTRARSTAESAAAVAGAFGGLAGFQLVGLLQSDLGFGGSLAAMAAGAATGAVLLLLLPETRGDPLPP